MAEVAAWRHRAAQARYAGEAVVVTREEYAELVRLRLCSDPLDIEEHDHDLWGVPLEVNGG